MRTTLTIDDDVLFAVRERARRERRSVGALLSELAREALNGQHRRTDSADDKGFHGFFPLPLRGGTVSNELIDRLREDEPE